LNPFSWRIFKALQERFYIQWITLGTSGTPNRATGIPDVIAHPSKIRSYFLGLACLSLASKMPTLSSVVFC